MSIADLIRLAQNRLATLNSARATAHAFGQDDRVASLDAEIAETEATLAILRTVE
jgi:hypothetical protein